MQELPAAGDSLQPPARRPGLSLRERHSCQVTCAFLSLRPPRARRAPGRAAPARCAPLTSLRSWAICCGLGACAEERYSTPRVASSSCCASSSTVSMCFLHSASSSSASSLASRRSLRVRCLARSLTRSSSARAAALVASASAEGLCCAAAAGARLLPRALPAAAAPRTRRAGGARSRRRGADEPRARAQVTIVAGRPRQRACPSVPSVRHPKERTCYYSGQEKKTKIVTPPSHSAVPCRAFGQERRSGEHPRRPHPSPARCCCARRAARPHRRRGK